MTNKKTFYVTTPIYYPTAKPHLGTSYTTIAADVLARWNHLQGKDVFFLTGTDEHGQKLYEAAKEKGVSPKAYVDELVKDFKKAWQELNIDFYGFIRTTDKKHEEAVKKIIQRIYENGDLYEGNYEGLYCIPCESYYTEKDLVNEKCPTCGREVQLFKEKAYFFKLSRYQKGLLDLYKENPEFILPESKRNEIVNRVKEGLKDVSFTRSKFSWGVEFPIDKKYVLWVWADALTNYLSALDWPNGKNFEKFWPANVHLVGKDILWFHAVILPAMLMSAKIKTPNTIFAHGWWTVNGQKISKSKGNVIDPLEISKKYGVDSFRYFLLRAVPFGEDGDFDELALVARHNNELADKLGNLVSRVSTLAEKYGIEKAEQAKELDSKETINKVSEHLEGFEFDKALNEIFSFIDKCNTYVQETSPWITKDKKVLYRLANAIKDMTILLSPFMPETCEKIAKTFNFEIKLSELDRPIKVSKIKKSDILFRKIDVDAAPLPTPQKSVNNINPKKDKIVGVVNMNTIKFEDFTKLDIRVGTIKKVEEIEGADKLYKLEVEVGKDKKILVAGIKQFYKKEELKDKQVVVIINLKPRKMRGVESEGMILAAVSDDHSKVILISPDKKIDSGSKIQ
jgi:methionyl-tRNA synthetase